MAQGRVGADDEQRRYEAAALGEGVVADGVDAAVDGAKPADAPTRCSICSAVEPRREQLRAADNPALTGGEPGDLSFRCTFSAHMW